MRLTEEQIKKFKEAWRAEFGEEIDPALARERFHEVLELYRALIAFKRDQLKWP